MKLARRTFIEEVEVEEFVAVLEQNGLLKTWGENLSKCFPVCKQNLMPDQSDVCREVAKQVFRQIETIEPIGRNLIFNQTQALQLFAYTRALLVQFLREYSSVYQNIIENIRNDLKDFFRVKKIDNWDKICEILSLAELQKDELDFQKNEKGEAIVIPNEVQYNTQLEAKPKGKIVWNAQPEKLTYLSTVLAFELKWINEPESWEKFFNIEVEFIGQIVCKNLHQGRIALLILLLREAKKLKVIHQKGFWSTVGNQFKGEKERPWKKDWAKVASEAGKDDRILRSFWKNIEPFLYNLGIEEEDIPKFLGRIGGLIEED